MDSEQRSFWAQVKVQDSGCWLWAGRVRTGRKAGFGMFSGRYAHRVAWELVMGPIPPGRSLVHGCPNRHCVRPDHLVLLRSSVAQRLDGAWSYERAL